MGKPLKILFISPPAGAVETALQELKSVGYDPVAVTVGGPDSTYRPGALVEFLEGKSWDAVVHAGLSAEAGDRESLLREAFDESEKRYRNLFELAPDAILVSVEGLIVLVNEAGARLLGARSEDELLGKRYLDFAHEESREMMEKRWTTLLEERRAVPRLEIRLRRLDGSDIFAETVHAPVLYKGAEAVQSVIRDVTARKKAEEALLLKQRQLSALSSKVSLVAERERHRIAGNIHDGLGQVLSLMKMKLDMLLARDHAVPRSKVRIEEVRNLAEQAIAQIHSIIHELSPPILHTMGLEAALEWLVSKAREDTGLQVSFTTEGVPPGLENDAKVFMYHAAGELIHNAYKHARANKVQVALVHRTDSVEIRVEDDGIGFDPSSVSIGAGVTGGFGLFNISIRCEQMGGSFLVDSSPGRGTAITLNIPASKSY